MLTLTLITTGLFAVSMAGLAVGKLGGRELRLSCAALAADCVCGDDGDGEPMVDPHEGEVVPMPFLVARVPERRQAA